MKLSADEVAKIATLARLRLTDDETQRFQTQLSDVLTYMEQLSEVDTKDVSVTAQVTGSLNVLADDVVQPSDRAARLVKLAPAQRDQQIEVKSVFEGDRG